MVRLLVVDDEPIIVDGLYERFAEMGEPQLDIYKAYSGTEALAWLNRKKIDVVVTDIKMPGVDGLALLKAIRMNWPACKVIFLTGHDKFEYVYEAIRYEGVSYLLKTEGYDSIVALVRKSLEEIRAGQRDGDLLREARQQLMKALPALQREFLHELLEGAAAPVTQAQLDELGIPMRADRPAVLVTGRAAEGGHAGGPGKADFFRAGMIVEGQLGRHAAILGAAYKNDMLWVLQIRDEAGRDWAATAGGTALYLKGVLESVQAVCRETFGIGVSFVVSGTVVGWDELAREYLSHRALLLPAGGPGTETVRVDDGLPEGGAAGPGGDLPDGRALQVKLKKAQMLEAFLEQGRREEFMAALAEIRDAVARLPVGGALYREAYYTVALALLAYINHHGAEGPDKPGREPGRLTEAGAFPTARQAFTYFEETAGALFEQQNADRERRSSAAVQRVQRHILDNPGGDLSLSSLADMVYFNPKYLSRLFKQATGVNLSDYIAYVRLNKVKELLLENRMKVHEIAEYAGYFSAPCFTRFFKKATGMTPQEWRASACESK